MSKRKMEILSGPFGTTAEVLGLINNIAVRGPLRRFAPQSHAVFVDSSGAIVLIVRSKESLSVDELVVIRDEKSPGTYFFLAASNLYTTEAELQERIETCVQAYAVSPSPDRTAERILYGKRVLILGAAPGKTPKDDSP